MNPRAIVRFVQNAECGLHFFFKFGVKEIDVVVIGVVVVAVAIPAH